MLGLIVGAPAIGLGVKAFTPGGLPLSRKKNLTGTGAKVTGVICILVGLLFFAEGIRGTLAVAGILGGAQ